MNKKTIRSFLCAGLMGLAALAGAEQTPTTATKPAEASQHPKADEPAPPAAIALPEVVVQAEVTAAALRDIEASPGADDATREIAVSCRTKRESARLGAREDHGQRPSPRCCAHSNADGNELDDRLG